MQQVVLMRSRFKISCVLSGTIIYHVNNLQQLLDLVPYDGTPFLNNHPAIRMVIEHSSQNSWDKIKDIVSRLELRY